MNKRDLDNKTLNSCIGQLRNAYLSFITEFYKAVRLPRVIDFITIKLNRTHNARNKNNM